MTKKLLLIIPLLFFTLSLSSGEEMKDLCGTVNALHLFQAGKLLLRPGLSGPEEYVQRTNFLIHFTRSGEDACDSSYALRVADAFDYSWSKQIDTLLWAAPPPDFAMGGDDRFDVYIFLQDPGIAGYCSPEVAYPDPYPEGASSYIAVDNRQESGYLKFTCAHEFNHACQMRYTTNEMDFIGENSAEWMGDVCYDDVNGYVWTLSTTPSPLMNPDYPITTFENVYQYAGGIWFMFLDQYYDRNCPRRIWERMGEVPGVNTLTAIDDVLRNNYASNLRFALKNYGLWRYLVGTYADTINYFSEGNLWPNVRLLSIHNDYPCSGTHGSYPLSNRGGTGYAQFQNGAGKLFVSFDGQNGPGWRCWVVGFQPGNPQPFEMNLDSASATGSDSFDWGTNQDFAIVPVVCDWEYANSGITFAYNADCRILKDVGIISVVGVPASADTGAVITPKAWIKNYGLSQETFSAFFRLAGYNNTQTVTLAPHDSTLQEFAACTLLTRGNNNYLCTLALNGDERAGNNSKTGRIIVWVKDAGAVSILNPAGTIGQGEFVQPRARIKNFGNYSVQCNAIFWIGNWNTTKFVSLGGGAEIDVTFDSLWLASDTGEYTTKCSTAYAADMNKSNDKITDHFVVGPPGIEEQTYPMPITNGEKFEIYNALGKEISSNRDKLNLSTLAPGVYFLKIQLGGKLINRKILVIH
jgi:hypothetical protein